MVVNNADWLVNEAKVSFVAAVKRSLKTKSESEMREQIIVNAKTMRIMIEGKTSAIMLWMEEYKITEGKENGIEPEG